jgi:hypothetical protein
MFVKTDINLTNQGKVFLFDQFFPTDLSDRLLTFFKTNTDWEESPIFAHLPGRLVYPGQNNIVNEIQEYANNNDVINELGQLAKHNLEFYGIDLWQDSQGYKISPHKDYMGEVCFCHLQIFITDKTDHSLGTAFYTDKSWKSVQFQIPYRHNFGYFMVTGQQIWHGLPMITQPIHRHSIQIRYTIK